ncbi:MAG: NAD(P)/FAD-dependent oxidoreductase [Defluviitaleaceae bacterium]|nr:NAD(P)/FAD-dependent oxidoreductase [Defluviitaleaceae bacterium]
MYDVIIIGAGVIGCAIARELSRYSLRTLVLEKGSDVAVGASKANSGIVHAGYDAKPGTLKAHYNMLGVSMFEEFSRELGFAFDMRGSFVVCMDEADVPKLEELMVRGQDNGVPGLEIVDGGRLRLLEPGVSEKAVKALYAPTGGIVSPYEMTLALAENAAENGVQFKFGAKVTGAAKGNDGNFTVTTTQGGFAARALINAAGVHADEVNNMISAYKINIVARKGEYIMLDKIGGVHSTIFQLPTKMGKGVLVSPTVDGNIILGPTAVDVDDKDDVSTTAAGLQGILKNALISVPGLRLDRTIVSFAGLRAHSADGDFIIGEAPDVKGMINAAGIESPGITSAPAIARHVGSIVVQMLDAKPDPGFNPIRKPHFNFRRSDDAARAAAVSRNPDYGRIVCRCELVSLGEMRDAIRSPVPARDMDALKRRTRTGMGRCQGSFCTSRALGLLAEELGVDLCEVTKFGENSRILYDRS